jgi:hypothetical protein
MPIVRERLAVARTALTRVRRCAQTAMIFVVRRPFPTAGALVLAATVVMAPDWWTRSLGLAWTTFCQYWLFATLLLLALVVLLASGMYHWAGADRHLLQRPAPPASARLSLFSHSLVLVVLAAAIAGVVGSVLWQAFGRPPLIAHSGNGQPSWTVQNTLDTLKIVLSVVAGIGGVAALTFAYRKQNLGEAAEWREDTKLFNERFGRAADQLGSDKSAVRLAGVYAMAGLADDWKAGRQMCIDILCGYLRMPYTPPHEAPPPSMRMPKVPIWHAWRQQRNFAADRVVVTTDTTGNAPTRALAEEQQVRHTVLRLFRDHLRPADGPEPHSWHGHHFDLTGAVMDGGDLSRVAIQNGTKIVFCHAKFCGGRVFFGGAELSGGEMNFLGAKFSSGEVLFSGAKFSGCAVYFQNAEFLGGEVDLSSPRSWKDPPTGIDGSEPGVRWPSQRYLSSIAGNGAR